MLLVCILIEKNYAQVNDTNYHKLREILILIKKQSISESSKKTITFDSLTLCRYNTTSIAELLSNQSTIHIKTYGNGNISTTSMRGGNANHTALLWNGLNIQNTMLGQTDLSLIPTFFFNQISLEYGGGSSIWGSGAIGGSIRLQNHLYFKKGIQTKLQMSVGSFNTNKIASEILVSYNKVVSSTKIYYNNSENNYSYKDVTDKENPIKKVKHSNYYAQGLLQELSFKLNSKQNLNFRAWYNSMYRNIPSYSSYESKKNQEDENIKLNADWSYFKAKFNSTIRLGYFNDKLNYTDSNANNLTSKSILKTIIGESDNILAFKTQKINFGINFTHYTSNLISTESSNYNTLQTHILYKFAFFTAYQINLFHSKLIYNISARKEISSLFKVPITGNTGIRYQPSKILSFKLNGNKSFRQPTMNDLYWQPGGNKNLNPEESYEVDGGIELNLQKNKFYLFIETTYFNRHTNNWIIWLPIGNSYWSPHNISEVYSRGTETKSELSYKTKSNVIKLILQTAYVLSTSQKNNSENDNSEGKQLIYTPRYTGQASILINYKNFNFILNTNYTGYRFTSSDNQKWLNPYYVTNAKCSYQYNYNTINIEVFYHLNNLFNKNYQIIANNPMPLINHEIGLIMQYKRNKKT